MAKGSRVTKTAVIGTSATAGGGERAERAPPVGRQPVDAIEDDGQHHGGGQEPDRP